MLARKLPSIHKGYARSAGESEYPQFPAKLIGAWVPGIQNSGTAIYDLSKNRNNVVLNSPTTTKYTSGFAGRALNFPGGASDYINIGTGYNSIPSGNFTLSMWCRSSQYASGDACFGWSGSDDIAVYPNSSAEGVTGVRIFWRNNGGSFLSDNAGDRTGKWLNIVFLSRSNTAHELWVNGTLVDTASNDKSSSTGFSNAAYIGGWEGSSIQRMYGDMDAIYLFDDDLIKGDIELLYEIPYAPFVKRRRIYGFTVAGSVVVTPAVASANAIAVAPDTILGSILTVPTVALSDALAVAPSVVLGSTVATPAAPIADAIAVAPTTVEGPINLVPAVALADAVAVAPTVAYGSTSTTPGAATANTNAVAPTTVLGSQTVTPAAPTADAVAIAPTVQEGGTLVTPAAAVLTAAAVAPTIVEGSINLTPGAAAANAAAVAPTVVQDSMTVTPGAVTANVAAVAPTVVEGSLNLTPAAPIADASAVAPTVSVAGSATVIPAAAIATTNAVAPTVVGGEAPAVSAPFVISSLSSTIVGHKRRITGKLTLTQGQVTITARDLGLNQLDDLIVEPTDGYVFAYIKSTGQLSAYYGDYDNASDGPLIVDTDVAIVSISFEAIGY